MNEVVGTVIDKINEWQHWLEDDSEYSFCQLAEEVINDMEEFKDEFMMKFGDDDED